MAPLTTKTERENWVYRNHLSLYYRVLQALVMRLRPAPIASALKRLLGTRRLRIETPHGIFWIDPLSLSGYVLSRTGQYEPEMERTFAEFLKSGSKFVDLGANEGYFTVLGAKICGPRGRVVAVEPQDGLLPVIAENLRLNGLKWVHVVQAAVSDKSGTATIHLSADVNCGGSSLIPHTKYRLPTQKVTTRTLTEILDEQGLDHVDFMKVDIESFEWEMLHGAPEAFKSRRIRAMAMEIHNEILQERGLDAAEIVNLLDRCGYRIVKPHRHWVWIV